MISNKALLATVVWLTPSPLLANDQAVPDRVVKDGESPPDLRPCIDGVGEGALRSDGYELINDPDDILGHAFYYYRYIPRYRWFGIPPMKPARLYRVAHGLQSVNVADAVIFTRSGAMVGWQWVWKDKTGRRFVPVFDWPEAATYWDWRPQAIKQVARRVSFRPGQPFWPDYPSTQPARPVVRYGLYLSDLPELFRLAGREQCWR